MLLRQGRLCFSAACVLLGACSDTHGERGDVGVEHAVSEPHSLRAADLPILPLPTEDAVDTELASLGKALFFSPIMSEDGQVSCGSCHRLDHGMAEPTPRSAIPGRPMTATNSTTLLNVAYLYKLTWSGAFDSLDAHLDALIENPKLMGSSWSSLTDRLNASPEWTARFRDVFPDGVSAEHAREALLAYERSLVTPGAPFDRWLLGDSEALDVQTLRGYQLFTEYGCVSCHQGMLVGGNMFQKLGVARDFFAEHPEDSAAGLGRYNFTERDGDRHVLRVPSLRNVALTPPYLHDGSAPTLEAAIGVMGKYQLGWQLPDEDVSLLASFLRSLTGVTRGDAP